MRNLARNSHYVPESYMKRWRDARGLVWAYRLLVPRAEYPAWQPRPTARIAVRRDFYTSVAGGSESDRLERWLNDEVENPAQPVLDKLMIGDRLSRTDRRRLARYIASLEARTPRSYERHTTALAAELDRSLDKMAEEWMTEFRRATRGNKRPKIPIVPSHEKHSIKVTFSEDPLDPDKGHMHVSIVVGREFWLASIRNVVDNVSQLMESHDWKVFAPHDGWHWFTSDHPLIRLAFNADGTHHLEGKWGEQGTRLLLPLSPRHLLCAEVGAPAPRGNAFDLDTTLLIHRLVCDRAHRWILDDHASHAPWFRRRLESLEAFRKEESEWEAYHEEQSMAEEQLRRSAHEIDPVGS